MAMEIKMHEAETSRIFLAIVDSGLLPPDRYRLVRIKRLGPGVE